MLYAANDYNGREVGAGETLVAWRSIISRTGHVCGHLLADEDCTLRLQCAPPASTPATAPGAGDAVDTEELDEWITLETAEITADTPVSFRFRLVARQHRLVVDCASETTLDAEVNVSVD